MHEFEPPIIVETDPNSPPLMSVIWLHGLGADGNDFVPVVPHLQLPQDIPTRFIFPQAPVRPVTVNGGYMMRAWYDILDMTLDRKIDLAHMLRSAEYCESLIEGEISKGVASENIFLVGFSQGGAVALHAALRSKYRLGGLICLSTYLVGEEKLKAELSEANRAIEVFWGHGEHDDVVAFDYGQRSVAQLKNWNYQVSWHTYPIAHEVCLPEIREIGSFLKDKSSCC